MSHSPIVSGQAAERGTKVINLPGPGLGALLIDSGKITTEDRDRILRAQAVSGQRFGQTAKQLGLLSDADIQHALSRQFGFAYLAPDEDSGLDTALVVAYEPFGAKAEAIRTIRSQLQQTWFNAGHKALAVVTPEANIGSELLGNLAIAYAQMGLRTLIVDANLRSPYQHQLFNLGRRAGLAELLAGRIGMGRDIVVPVPAFEGLAILSAGTVPPNPQELLCQATCRSVLRDLAVDYDVVLIDTPPCVDNIDACVIGAIAGAAVITARRNVSRLRDVKAVHRALTLAGVPLVGAVLADG